MSKCPARPVIRLRGVRQHNLKNINLDLPLGRLIVITGLSGSGKSSLAFDTLFAEGQRRYIETFSPYARQFFDRMDKPAADRIDGIPPAIAIEQRNAVKTTRSTVGTLTEICDYMKMLWPHLARLHCRQCGQEVRKESPQRIWETVNAALDGPDSELVITFELPLSARLSLDDSLALVAKQGYQRLLVGNDLVRLEEAGQRLQGLAPSCLTVVQDRLSGKAGHRARFIEACEQAYHFGKGRLAVFEFRPPGSWRKLRAFSNRLHCAECDLDYREPTPALFSFNHPVGACPKCRGFGRIILIDYALAVPDRTLSITEGLVRPWRSGFSAECQDDLIKFCKRRGVRTNVPFCDLPPDQQEWIIHGDAGYGTDDAHQWPRAWYGVKGYFRWLESKTYKMHVRVLLSRYRAYQPCPDCGGTRFQPEALLYRLPRAGGPGLSLADLYRLPIKDAALLVEQLALEHGLKRSDPLGVVLKEALSRLGYLVEVGLGYISLDRPTRTLSGGETERVNLTTCLGTRLVNTLFILDEPSVGLHPRDTARLVRILEHLRDAGNTLVVVEHEAGLIRAADQVVDLGPGHGETGGQVVFQGTYREILKSKDSLTGQYLSGRKTIETPPRRNVALGPEDGPALVLRHAAGHNLKDLTVEIPLGRFVCVTGVSGSGKTTLVREVLLPGLEARFKPEPAALATGGDEEEDEAENDASPGLPALVIEGWESLGQVTLVDQSALGKTPRSNPAVYTGTFDDIRELFAQSEEARQRGLNASAFSFNSGQGQCERCRGAGFEKIEMQFLSDVFIRCPECNGRRYRPHILEVILQAGSPARGWSIADLLEATVDEVVQFLGSFPGAKPARRAVSGLRLLQEVGLGYLRLGQPINTLSGGESQRLKLVRHLAGTAAAGAGPGQAGRESEREGAAVPEKSTLFLFDEPTTGLHFHDVQSLVRVFQRLVDQGHSVLVIEHNLDLIKCADWIIDLGPEAGEEGGRLVVRGTPEQVAACRDSHTGRALREVLPRTANSAARS
jgi:excinuclease ABC subunit A